MRRAVSFAFFDSFANFHFLFAGEQRDFAHLAQVHLDGIVQDVQAAFCLLLPVRPAGLAALQVGRFDDLDLEAAQFGVNGVEEFGRNKLIRDGVVDVVIGEVALFLAKRSNSLIFSATTGESTVRADMGDGDGGAAGWGGCKVPPAAEEPFLRGAALPLVLDWRVKRASLAPFFNRGVDLGAIFRLLPRKFCFAAY